MHIVEDEIVMVPVQVKGRLVEEGVVLPHKLTTYKEYYYVRARSTYNCTTAHSTWCIVLPQIISTVISVIMQRPNIYRKYATPIFDSSFLLILS